MAVAPRMTSNGKTLGSLEDMTQLHKSEQWDDAFKAMDLMHKLGMLISQDMVQCLLQDCTERKVLTAGRRMHTLMMSSGLDSVAILGDYLIRLFGSCGSLVEADLVFCKVPKPSVYTWQAIISAHGNYGECEKAVKLYIKMQGGGILTNKFIFLCILKACGRLRTIEHGRRAHAEIMAIGLESDVIVGSSLIDMHAKCGCLQDARKVFDTLPDRNVVSWDAMITGYVQYGHGDLALQLFEEMQQENVQPNKVTYLCTLKACSSVPALHQGKLIHVEVITSGLESDMMIGNTLIDMYAKCGSFDDACRVFENLPSRDPVSWGALIAGCALHKHGLHALRLFERMQHECINANKVMLLCILKACSDIGALIEAKLIHDLLVRNGLILEMDVGNTLLDIYAKCGSLEEARNVFENLPNPDIVSWGAMISGYSQHGHGLLALELFDSMKHTGLTPNSFIFPCVLKACGSVGALRQGMLMHEDAIRDGVDADLVVGNALVDMYAKCGSMDEAHKVFQGLPTRNIVSWSAMIAGYAQHEHGFCAMDFFEKMQDAGIKPNKVTFLSTLKACGSAGALVNGKLIHEKIIKNGFESDVVIANTLVDMYWKCGNLEAAREVFDKIPNPDDITWGAMIAGYAQAGLDLAAIELFERMQREGRKPHEFTFPCILKACGSVGALVHAKLIHDQIIKTGLSSDVIVGSALVDVYAKCGSLEEARRVFDNSEQINEVSWGAMITGYTQHGHCGLALELFQKMQQENFKPDTATLLCILKACGYMGALGQGHMIHELIIRSGFDADNILGSSIVDMYAKCGSLEEAWKVFDELSDPDIVLWGSMIAGYAQQGLIVSALKLYHKMQQYGLKPNNVIYLSILKACCSVGAIEHGKSIHDQIVQTGFESDPLVGNMLVDMYSKCGNLEEACRVFNELSNRDVVSWSVMMAGYSQRGHGLSALKLFERMQHEGVDPGKVTFLCVLKACGSLGSLKQGRLIHHQIIRSGLESDTVVGNTLVHMYARCGNLEEAHKVFDHLSNHKEVSWSVIIAGYARYGNNVQAKLCLGDMQQQGLKPHDMMYSNIISACSHAGQVDEGHHYFAAMQEVHNIPPSIEHCNCVVDLLARAGCLKQAEQFLQAMPISPDLTGWMSLLTSCKTYGNVEIGRQCFDRVVQIDPDTAAGYVLMSNIYASANMWEDFQEVQDLRKGRSAWKKPGRAWIELDNCTNNFIVGERDHPESSKISIYLDRLWNVMKGEGYVPCLDVAVDQITDESVEAFVGRQGEENLSSIAFGLSVASEPVIQAGIKHFLPCIRVNNYHDWGWGGFSSRDFLVLVVGSVFLIGKAREWDL